jgi:hypothetical protein
VHLNLKSNVGEGHENHVTNAAEKKNSCEQILNHCGFIKYSNRTITHFDTSHQWTTP